MINLVKLCLFALIVGSGESAPPPASPHAKPLSRSWPPMKSFDIWDSPAATDTAVATSGKASGSRHLNSLSQDSSKSSYYFNRTHENYLNHYQQLQNADRTNRKAKVLNFFPVPVDEECLSDDGRRSGSCLNVYECRMQGGTSRGDCALGFGVCCVFTVTCDQEIKNNITYFVSPDFPAIMPRSAKSCNLKIKMIHPDVSQLRLDFVHFTMGQPNRRTGNCDGDLFSLGGGLKEFSFCGQNSGQHIYYDVDASKGNDLNLVMNFTSRAYSPRLWEIRVVQIPFSQRAPSGCLQYFTGREGLIETFNYAENGRHLSNQKYRSCIRQETGMCSIAYEPCHDQAFRIGNGQDQQDPQNQGLNTPGQFPQGMFPMFPGMFPMPGNPPFGDTPLADQFPGGVGDNFGAGDEALGDPVADETAADDVAADDTAADDPAADDAGSDGADGDNGDTADNNADNPQSDDPSADEGSGGGGFGSFFDFGSFFGREEGKAMKKRSQRQLYTTCKDRITMPCIVEDFIGAGMGDLPSCVPIHCGNSLCAPGVSPCRLETSVTPFGIGINFGDGVDKGSPEDNIGACLKYNQVECSE